ncbi:MAG: FixH family protein [Gammaproteobacteria bacterium]
MPWYRQFWPWFLIALPASAVVAGFATLFIASTDPDGLVVDDYYRQGLAINRDFERQRKAETQGLHGDFAYDAGAGTASLRLEGSAAAIEQLTLHLAHSTRANKDIDTILHRDMTGKFSGLLRFPGPGRWQVVVDAPDSAWRLTGTLELPGVGSAALSPS